MTPEQCTKAIRKELNDIKISQTKSIKGLPPMMLRIGTQIKADSMERIFSKGRNSKGGIIGTYSTDDTLAGASSFATKKGFDRIAGTKAKRRQLDWRKVKGHNLFIVEGGYKKIRELSGRPTNTVNLDFTGQLKANYGFQVKGNAVEIGFGEARRLTPDGKPAKTKNSDILKGIDDNYGDVFSSTKKEDDRAVKIALEYADKIILNIQN